MVTSIHSEVLTELFQLSKRDWTPWVQKIDSLKRTRLTELTKYHYDHCENYKKIVDFQTFEVSHHFDLADYPFLPARIFKDADLMSVPRSDVFRTLNSSGTSASGLTRIFLDKENVNNQIRALQAVVQPVLGPKRIPMLVIDRPSIISPATTFAARSAGVRGFMTFSSRILFAFDESGEIDYEQLELFAKCSADSGGFLFGFTSVIWWDFIERLVDNPFPESLNLKLIHGGGWKKMLLHEVENTKFNQRCTESLGVSKIFNYYGMVEQTGSIFFDCEKGYLHSNPLNDVLIRSPLDFSLQGHNQSGLIQVFSVLPTSYPGHSILTEDIGVIAFKDDCPCGRAGTAFHVQGRLMNAEIRGCSDAYLE